MKHLPEKLISRKVNVYQVLFVAMVSYLAFRILLPLFVNHPDTPPE